MAHIVMAWTVTSYGPCSHGVYSYGRTRTSRSSRVGALSPARSPPSTRPSRRRTACIPPAPSALFFFWSLPMDLSEEGQGGGGLGGRAFGGLRTAPRLSAFAAALPRHFFFILGGHSRSAIVGGVPRGLEQRLDPCVLRKPCMCADVGAGARVDA